MPNKLIIALVAMSITSCYAQIPDDLKLIKSFLPEDEKVYYLNKLPGYNYNYLKMELEKDTLMSLKYTAIQESITDSLINLERIYRREFLVLSAEEKDSVNKQLENMRGEIWPPKLFENSYVIDTDTLNRVPDTIPYYVFSKPILIRNGTVGIFFYSSRCGSLCGSGELLVLIKRKNKWEKWLIINSWIS